MTVARFDRNRAFKIGLLNSLARFGCDLKHACCVHGGGSGVAAGTGLQVRIKHARNNRGEMTRGITARIPHHLRSLCLVRERLLRRRVLLVWRATASNGHVRQGQGRSG